MRCATCGEEHELLEPSFKRPDDVVTMLAEERAARVKEDDDLCLVRGGNEAADRFFVRCVLPVRLLDGEEDVVSWGLWAEVEEASFWRILELWRDPDQASEPAMAARLANHVSGYPETRDLPVTLHLTTPTSRAALAFSTDAVHPFARECLEGVTVHRVHEWLAGARR